jgi:GYF domain 2
MDSPWFYGDAGQALGPVGLDELLGRLFAMPNPHGVLVWREGQGDWKAAESVPEISSRLPPPLSGVAGAVPARPVMSAGGAAMAARLKPVEDAEVIARLYRRLVLLVGSQIPLGIFNAAVQGFPEAMKVGSELVIILAAVAVGVTLLATTYQLSSRLDSGPPILWTIGMFFPCLNFLVLLALSLVAQAWCKRQGIKVGFLGPTRESIEDLRRRLSTSAFD